MFFYIKVTSLTVTTLLELGIKPWTLPSEMAVLSPAICNQCVMVYKLQKSAKRPWIFVTWPRGANITDTC